MYRTGDFHICQNGCMIVLQQDLEFWCIDELVMAPCCALKYYQQLEIGQNEKDDDNNTRKKEIELAEEEDFGNSLVGRFRTITWNTIEYPWTNKFARGLAIFSLTMVLLSTFTFVLSTIDELQVNFLHFSIFNNVFRFSRIPFRKFGF
ncbi:potassium voltage-gated channel protein Shab [Eurytemora carolleeae]|uniref:potassium voltage-gated channel protein Shab n=1 Tax=Eurytemora carolleeae TaxID=1294199 RepID=UPI000C77D062|nr:potassium voltage-gated channel protein Shab [Eurytemora carolleeae]|eukprot:XP_023335014.1 potassium voltage-gated channel protein Shab-like [Eurytemora affinis]